MKRIIISILAAVLFFIIPTQVFASPKLDEHQPSSLTHQEIETMNYIKNTIDKNKYEINVLKEKGVFDDYLDEVSLKMKGYVEKSNAETLHQISQYHINANDTVKELRGQAQNYLNIHFNGLKIGSKSFEKLVHKYLDNEDMATVNLAKKDPDFGQLYLYMCIYDSYVLDNEKTTVLDYSNYNDSNDIDNMIILNIIEQDSKEAFIDTEAPQILNNYIQIYAKSNNWPSLNGSNVQSYARTYAKTYNTNYIAQSADCTNFASQALKAGGLPMNYTNADKNSQGYITTTTRWFHFKTNANKYSISTSWIRVVELYSYLSPHYAVYETTSGSNMTPYLNKGFLLQGKHLVGKYKHSVIITKKNGNVCYCSHTSDRKDEPISTFYNGFHKYRVVQTY